MVIARYASDNPGHVVHVLAKDGINSRRMTDELIACAEKLRATQRHDVSVITAAPFTNTLSFSAEHPDQLRGRQCHLAWAHGVAPGEALDSLTFGTMLGSGPVVLVTEVG